MSPPWFCVRPFCQTFEQTKRIFVAVPICSMIQYLVVFQNDVRPDSQFKRLKHRIDSEMKRFKRSSPGTIQSLPFSSKNNEA